MVNCPACESDMDLDEEQLLEGGVVSCGGCGAHFEVVSPHPLELEQIGSEEDEDDEDDDDELDEDFGDDEDDDFDEDDEDGYEDDDDGLDDEDDED